MKRTIIHFVFLYLTGLTITLTSLSIKAACVLIPRSGNDIPPGTIVTTSLSSGTSAIQMPQDIAVGTELFRVTARQSSYASYQTNCNNNTMKKNYYTLGRFTNSPPAVALTSTPYGVAYETGIPGIGLVIQTGAGNRLLGEKTYYTDFCYSNTSSCGTNGQDANITYILVKTGNITNGSIDLASLPLLESVTGGNNSPGSDIVIFRSMLSGIINFTQATCALAEKSKTVKLGEHTHTTLMDSTPYTPWTDASIDLINCNYGGAQYYGIQQIGYSNTSTITDLGAVNIANAQWSLTLTPLTIIDNNNGIMALAPQSDSATGVGIQLSTTNTATPNLVKFSQHVNGPMIAGMNQTMRIPLYARYIRTSPIVTGGKADGKVTYTVEYK
ncbi:fimbrial protein [Citrobacter sp. BDA59-3]|uniref:fimbrial protein n=1 Tax=Citrobacter sp. BDA59-3 TaxID=2781952 RepID=UPI00187EC971|nr:fimbrial protein [Citrobacter sp. BDA59-3]QOV69747.1 type 1 fimbrial protein [Citrobacter sp. BDA59-3]